MVEVTQEDRDAAYAYWIYIRSLPPTDYRAVDARERFGNGSKDSMESVQAFARHREAALATAQAENAELRRQLDEARGLSSPLILEIMTEVQKAIAKFPTWPTRIIDAGNVVSEEAGELAKACLQVTYEPHKETLAGVRMEAVQTAAMCLRFLASMDRYDTTPGPQHEQSTGYEPRYCDQCGAIKSDARSTHCAPPYDVKPHTWTGKHPADARAINALAKGGEA